MAVAASRQHALPSERAPGARVPLRPPWTRAHGAAPSVRACRARMRWSRPWRRGPCSGPVLMAPPSPTWRAGRPRGCCRRL